MSIKKISRRNFMLGLAGTGVLPLVGWGIHKFTKKEEVVIDEESIVPAPIEESIIANHIKGEWTFRLIDDHQNIASVLSDQAQLFLDIGAGGRSIRGYLSKQPELILNDLANTGFHLMGTMITGAVPKIRLMLDRSFSNTTNFTFEFDGVLDQVWGNRNTGGGPAFLNGSVEYRSIQSSNVVKRCSFIAEKKSFPLASQQIPLNAGMMGWLSSPGHRLYHQLWHAVRDKWHKMSEDKRQALRNLDWQPGPKNFERDARGIKRRTNASGEDFFFMHRSMLRHARSLQDLPSWSNLPLPCPFISHDMPAFIKYYQNRDGTSVPPIWVIPEDNDFSQWLLDNKGVMGFFSNLQLWEAQFHDPDYLSKMTLGEFGSRVELGLHDWLHMRWASVAVDPSNGLAVPTGRDFLDHALRWFLPENDFLGDPFSSHVNPIFWRFHGWIDDRLDDWYWAHERAHPGEIIRKEVKGVPWFAKGKWVKIEEPWLGPTQSDCGAMLRKGIGATNGLQTELMKFGLKIAFSVDEGREKDAPKSFLKESKRPWYARNLAEPLPKI